MAAERNTRRVARFFEHEMNRLANENAGEETPVLEQRDAVVMVRDYLKKHPEACKIDLLSHSGTANGKRGRGRLPGEQHEHGSVTCVA